MATSCTNCGALLPKGDAQFCNNCGMSVVVHPVHPESALASKDDAASSPRSKPTTPHAASSQRKSRPVLREQIAQQPPARPMRLVSPDKASRPATRGEALSAPAQEQKAEELPTGPLVAHPPEPPSTFPVAEHTVQHTLQDEVALRDTVHLATSTQSSPVVPSTPAPPVRQQASSESRQSKQRRQTQGNIADRPGSPLPSMRRRPRIPLLIIAILLCLLAAGGLGTWIVMFQPFSVPAITQPQQSFKDISLGLSLLYPSGWMIQVDRAKATVQFSDSSHTSEVIIAVKNAATSDVIQSLQRQVAQSGLTGTKVGTPLSFAGVTWQLIQGSVQRSGANYTETLLATVHGNYLCTLIQLAPQSIYADEEKLVFSGMRSSLQFT